MPAVFGIQFTELSQQELVGHISRTPVPVRSGPRVLMTTNVDHVVHLRRNDDFRRAYAHAWVATADGMPVYGYARLRGAELPARLTGADVFREVMSELSPDRHRCFFAPSTRATADRLAAYLRSKGFAEDAIAFDVPPLGFEQDPCYSDRLAWRIRAHRPTHVFFGLGSPKSEIWLDRQREALGDCYVLNVGAGLDFFVGRRRRAPAWMQRSGLEWLWRFGHEPRRLFRRYFLDSWQFLAAVRDDLARRRERDRRASAPSRRRA